MNAINEIDPIESLWQSLFIGLSRSGAEPVYCLIDPFLRPPAPYEALGEWLASHPAQTVKIPHAAVAPESYPLLLKLDLANPDEAEFTRALLAEAVEENQPQPLTEGLGRRICAFLVSDAEPEKLLRHLGLQALVTRQGQKVLLRYYDPAVFPQLWQVFQEEQQARLLGPVSAWWCLDQAQTWQKFAAPAQSGRGRLWLQMQQWQALDDVGLCNRVFNDYWQEKEIADPAWFARIRSALQRARSLGFVRETDLLVYAGHALRYGSEFDRHPKLRAAIDGRTAGESYLSLIADLDENDWQSVAQGRIASLAMEQN